MTVSTNPEYIMPRFMSIIAGSNSACEPDRLPLPVTHRRDCAVIASSGERTDSRVSQYRFALAPESNSRYYLQGPEFPGSGILYVFTCLSRLKLLIFGISEDDNPGCHCEAIYGITGKTLTKES